MILESAGNFQLGWRHEERDFVVRTQQAREVLASVGIVAKDFPVFLPMRTVEISHARKRERVNRPLFPRYLFVNFIEAEKLYGKINRVRGVIKLLCANDGIPYPVPKKVMVDLRDFHRQIQAKTGEITSGWQPGDVFKIACGRYADFEASYVGEDKGEVTVIIRMFNRDFMLPLPFSEIPPCKKLFDNLVA